MTRDEIIKMAFELGVAISESQEMNDFRESQSDVLKDAEAYSLVSNYQEARERLDVMMEKGHNPTEEEQKILLDLEQALDENPLLKDLVASQETMTNLMNAVFYSINQAANGSEGCSGEDCSGCGGSCC
ncbi:MAG: YlbF family regulator [Ignavibacteriales bacterium]